MNHEKFLGCDEDCFHCKYSDCLKAAGKIKSEKIKKRSVMRDEVRTQSRMYTLELGGVGRNMPNISKKYYL